MIYTVIYLTIDVCKFVEHCNDYDLLDKYKNININFIKNVFCTCDPVHHHTYIHLIIPINKANHLNFFSAI